LNNKLILLSLCFSFISYTVTAQQLLLETYSGFNIPVYKPENISEKTGYAPVGVRLAGGIHHAQVGVEYMQGLQGSNYTFLADDNGDIRDLSFTNTYRGIFFRGNASSLPAYRSGFTLRLGAGYHDIEINDTHPQEAGNSVVKLEKVPGYNIGVGISNPIYTLLHFTFSYNYHIVATDDLTDLVLIDNGINLNYHSIQVGLSLNMVFGNTKKKCRRIIESERGR